MTASQSFSSKSAGARGVHLAVLILLGSMALLVLLALLCEGGWLGEPFRSAVAVLTSCPHKLRTGKPCPLCGTTTAAIFLLQGRLRESLMVNPLGLGLAVAGVFQVVYRGIRVVHPAWRLREEILVDGASIAAVIAVLVIY